MNIRVANCLLASLILAACSTTTAVSAEAETVTAEPAEKVTIKAKIIENLSAKELWHSQAPVTYGSSGGARIGYWAADVENMPMDGDWTSPGVVMAGMGDIDEKPVAVRIWTKAGDVFLKDQSLSESENGDDAVALFGGAYGAVRLRFVVTSSAEVLVDDEEIGVVE